MKYHDVCSYGSYLWIICHFQGRNRRNEDGLLYVVIDFGNKQPSQEIHRAEKSTEYAAIAIGEVGPHLQPEEDKAEKWRNKSWLICSV